MAEAHDAELSIIQRCVREGCLFWTYHVNMRLAERGVNRSMVVESVDTYRIIEHYPQGESSRYLPSYLVNAVHSGSPRHILFAVDKEDETVRVITVYHPDPEQWDNSFTQRRKS